MYFTSELPDDMTNLIGKWRSYFTSELPDDMTNLIGKWRSYISNRELE